jgi:hypothetical protein
MLTAIERVLILRGADLLRDVGPRHLLELAEVAREVELTVGTTLYQAEDMADALYIVIEGRVRLTAAGKTIAEVGPGEAFGTWAIVDDSARGQSAECVADGAALALHRDAFYDVAASDLTLLQEVVRALARRLRALVAERPEEARIEGEGVETPQAMIAKADPPATPAPAPTENATPGAALAAAAAGRPAPGAPDAGVVTPAAIPTAEAERTSDVQTSATTPEGVRTIDE